MSRRTPRRIAQQGPRVDPFVSYLLFIGIGVGTWQMSRPWRQTLLWFFLLAAFLLYVEIRPVKPSFTLSNVGWGALIGIVVSVPFLALAWVYLYGIAVQLFTTTDAHLLFYQLCLFAAPVEELYFRGFMQREKGMQLSAVLYALAALVYFVPGLNVPALALAVVTGAYVAFGLVYSYVYARHGLSAAVTSHFVVNVVTLVLPSLIRYISQTI